MTKEQLRNYQAIKKEICHIERLLRNLEKQPEIERESLRQLRELYRGKLDALVALQVSIEEAIDSLDTVEREIFRYRYIDGLEWHQVAAKIHYSWTNTHRIHAAALIKLEKK
jgi:DNA-directed RNA polymerase specialized sigma24 family protein